MLIEDFSPNALIYWEDDIKAVRVEWHALFMPLEKFQQIIGRGLALAQQQQSSVWIVDSYQSDGNFTKEVTAFISNQGSEAFKEYGIEHVFTVMPKELGLASLSTKRWNNDVKEKHDFKMNEFPTLDLCIQWIKERVH